VNLEKIGFYTLSNKRAASSSVTSNLSRCELILTGKCNFNCPYCRHIGGPDLSYQAAIDTLNLWFKDWLKNSSSCGTVDKSFRNGEVYQCSCGMVIDADTNAAINILHRGVYNPSNQEEQFLENL